jgi:phage tail-like protein
MAEQRADRPYAQFNFLVQITPGASSDKAEAGFQEVSGLGMEITHADYRAGNYKFNAPIKVQGTFKVNDVTLKRGVIGVLDLYGWLDSVRTGGLDLRTVTIKLQSEDRSKVAQQWVLSNARPVKYTGPALNGKGTDVAVEELVLACEMIDLS